MKKILRIPVDVYKMEVVVFLGVPAKRIVKWGKPIYRLTGSWRRKLRRLIEEPALDGFCCAFDDYSYDLLIWVRDRPKSPRECRVLFHELYHATDKIATYYDPNDRLGEEGRAYLFEHLASETFAQLWLKGGGIEGKP